LDSQSVSEELVSPDWIIRQLKAKAMMSPRTASLAEDFRERRDHCAWRVVSRLVAAIFLLTLTVCNEARADMISLTTGERVVGKIVSESAAFVLFDSEGLGQIQIARQQIEKIERDPAPAPVIASEVASPSLAGDTNALPLPIPSWMPIPRGDERFDWVQLKSGEWLKGRMKSLQDEKLEFDSEEMDVHEFHWEDIRALRLPRLNSVWFGNRQTVLGQVLITTNEVFVLGAAANAFSRAKLLAVTPTGEKEHNNWSGKVTSGLTLRSGNTKQMDYNGRVAVDRRTPSTHLSFDYLGNIGRVEGEETVNNHRVTTEFDYFLSRRLFLLVPFAEYYRDPLQNLDHRLTVGVGVGYDLVKNRRVEWNLTSGPAYQRNWFSSVSPGDEDQPGALALVVGSRVEVELTRRVDFISELRAQITSREVGETTYHGVSTLQFEIHKRLDLDVSFIWDRISNPQADASGITPAKDDFRLIIGLGIDF
jgi:putative salt-induced outer membrane protein YdiY